jgi:hypothetical protein
MIIEEYATTDIVLASCLKYFGFNLSRIQTQGKRGIFYFYAVEKQFLENFDKNLVSVEPIKFHSILKQLNIAVRRQVDIGGSS